MIGIININASFRFTEIWLKNFKGSSSFYSFSHRILSERCFDHGIRQVMVEEVPLHLF